MSTVSGGGHGVNKSKKAPAIKDPTDDWMAGGPEDQRLVSWLATMTPVRRDNKVGAHGRDQHDENTGSWRVDSTSWQQHPDIGMNLTKSERDDVGGYGDPYGDVKLYDHIGQLSFGEEWLEGVGEWHDSATALPSYLQPSFREQFEEVEKAVEVLREAHSQNPPGELVAGGDQVRRLRVGGLSLDTRNCRPAVRPGGTFHLRGSESHESGMAF